MRACPHCGKEIQDEAIVCRYCGLNVDPPEWLRHKVRCDYCAEWIDPGLELCPYCKSDLVDVETDPAREAPPPPPFTDSLDSLMEDAVSPAASEPPAPEPATAPPEHRPVEASAAESSVSAQQPYFDPEWPGEEVEDPLRARLLEESAGRPSFTAPAWLRGPSLARILRIGALAGVVLVAVVGVVVLVRQLGPKITPTEVAARPTDTEAAPRTAPALSATSSLESDLDGTRAPTAAGECLLWDRVTLDDAGQEMCAYGTVKRWFAVGELPFVAIFTEESGTFALVDRSQAHPEIRPGMCIQGEGLVEVMSATRPFIDLNGEVLPCPEP